MSKASKEAKEERKKLRHTGRVDQIWIYLGKMVRMFIFQNDWKVMPMAAVIAGLVCFVVGSNLFKSMEGTLRGTFALSCVCIWNGFFNSIQVVCRERPIIKREHRAGMHMSSYIIAHMIYQAGLCLAQSVIMMFVCITFKVKFPTASYMTGNATLDMAIAIFLTTYCADIMALMVSSIVHSTTTAMTIMPFLLIFQLVFSGGFFSLHGFALKLTDYTVAKWGLTAMCAQGDYNHLPMTMAWSSMEKMSDVKLSEIKMDTKDLADMLDTEPELVQQAIDMGALVVDPDTKPIKQFLRVMEDNGKKDAFMMGCAAHNTIPEYEATRENILNAWLHLIGYIVLFAAIATISLEFVDRDKR